MIKRNYYKKIALCLALITVTIFSIFGCSSEKEFDGIKLNDVTVVYDQSGHNVVIEGIEKYPDASVNLSEEHINAGSYEQTLTVTQQGYKPLTLTATLTINKATPKITPHLYDNSADEKRVKYNGEQQPLDCLINYEQREFATYEYYFNDVKLDAPPSAVGRYTVKITVPEVNNYYGKTQTFNLVIIEPHYAITFYALNPLTNETVEVGLLQFESNGKIDLNYISSSLKLPLYDDYVFDGWFVDDEPITADYKYGKSVTAIGKYKKSI